MKNRDAVLGYRGRDGSDRGLNVTLLAPSQDDHDHQRDGVSHFSVLCDRNFDARHSVDAPVPCLPRHRVGKNAQNFLEKSLRNQFDLPVQLKRRELWLMLVMVA